MTCRSRGVAVAARHPRHSGRPRAGPGATTDANGTARFRLPAGLRPGTYRLTVIAASGLRLRAAVALTTLAAPEWGAVVAPAELVQRSGSRAGSRCGSA
jgi:hypothetical protein